MASTWPSGKPPVVLDLGEAWVRCGFAGEARPRRVVRSPLLAPQRAADATAAADDKGVLSRQEWVDLLSPFFCSLYTCHLQCKPRERGLVMCESMTLAAAAREAVAEVLFTHLQIPSLLLASGPAPVLYCTGCVDGIVLDIGLREARVLAVYRGVPLLHTYQGESSAQARSNASPPPESFVSALHVS
jgi:actin-related protein 10